MEYSPKLCGRSLPESKLNFPGGHNNRAFTCADSVRLRWQALFLARLFALRTKLRLPKEPTVSRMQAPETIGVGGTRQRQGRCQFVLAFRKAKGGHERLDLLGLPLHRNGVGTASGAAEAGAAR